MKPSGILIRLLVGLLAFCAIMAMASFKERPGMCPMPPPDKVTPCIASCAEDSVCLWPEKCCSWGCRKSCLTPVYGLLASQDWSCKDFGDSKPAVRSPIL
ncbi:auswaprin-a-like [Sceloporus undulatus]|uniref:auswaprin-a-like n=1 Tax=Sceloporus undulatus TaxID=8520 RepID=UPI001C4C57A7|nr:auswaprin-a-like [Sceloporus undulatus]